MEAVLQVQTANRHSDASTHVDVVTEPHLLRVC